jgi:hypothetical protein
MHYLAFVKYSVQFEKKLKESRESEPTNIPNGPMETCG